MKKKILIGVLIVIMCFLVVGCGKSQNNNSNSNNNSNNNNNNNNSNSNNNTNNDTPEPVPADSLTPLTVNKEYIEDLPLGLETNYPKANGNELVVRIQTSGSSKQQTNGPYFIYYNVYVGNDALGYGFIRDGIYHLEGYGITMLKEFDIESEDGHNYEFFEWDFTSSTHKGTDKDYVAISIPAGVEDKNQASLMITTDNGKLLGEFIADVVHDITLTGPDVEKYRNHSGDIVFNSIKDGNITYLTPTEAMYTTDESGKKVLNPALEEIELEEHTVTMDNNKAIDTKTENIYKITDAAGKTFYFSEFRHL